MKPDFIVVGAGSAGCVVADKLSENGRYSVAVLEAGGTDNRFFVQLPLGYGKLFFDKSVNWMYETEPDKGLAGNQDFWPRGKVVGGSSSINAMAWIRGAPQDFDDWRDAGNVGWGWQDMLPIFKAIEANPDGANELRGADGPMQLSNIENRVHPLTHDFVAACEQIGLKKNSDFNGANQEGAGYWQINTKNGRRMSAARAFLKPALKRKNVTLIKNAHVTKIRFEGKRAVGVDYVQNGKPVSLDVGKEIILSGGTINSPQLLELSGIGSPSILKKQDIEVVQANSYVGENLQDHQGINYTYKSNQKTLNDILRPWWGKLYVGARYLLLRDGPLSLSINHGGGFFKTSEKFKRPNIQLYFQAFSTVIPGVGERPILTPDPFSGFSIGLSNCRTHSRGSIHIKSSDPFIHPRIDANVFSDQRDINEMLDAVKFVRKIAKAPAMSEKILEEILPGPQVQSDEDLIEDFKKRSGTVFHPVSTCRMGGDAKSSVVSPRLKVHGVEGLRVIDASVFPNVVSGNTNAAAIATGWKGRYDDFGGSCMIVKEFKTWVVGNPPPRAGGRYFIFVKLVTDSGVVGYGECYAATFDPHLTAKMIEDVAERYLVGQDPHDVERLFRLCYSSGFSQRPDITMMGCFSALEIACWDIIGKEADKPIYKLLGGRVHETLRSYTYIYPKSGDVYPDGNEKNVYNDPDMAAEVASDCIAQGFDAVKFDPAGPYTIYDGHMPTLDDIDLSARMCKAIREAVGTKADLLFGTHGQFTAGGAIRLAKAIEPYDPLWFEEPVPPDMPEVMGQVARATSIPIATGERLTTRFEFGRVIENRAASILQPNTGRSGGILETKKIAAMAEVYHIQIAPHCYCGPIVGAANMQVATSLPNFLILESIKTWDGFHGKLLKRKIEWEDGHVIPPTEPGLGVELDEAVCDANPWSGDSLHLEMERTPRLP